MCTWCDIWPNSTYKLNKWWCKELNSVDIRHWYQPSLLRCNRTVGTDPISVSCSMDGSQWNVCQIQHDIRLLHSHHCRFLKLVTLITSHWCLNFQIAPSLLFIILLLGRKKYRESVDNHKSPFNTKSCYTNYGLVCSKGGDQPRM